MLKWIFDLWYKTDPNTKYTVLVTLTTFILGYIIAEILKYAARLKERKSYRKSFYFLLSDFIKGCSKQESVVSRSLENSDLLKGQNFIIQFANLGTLSYLVQIDLIELVKKFDSYFNQKLKAKAVSKIISLISAINMTQTQTKEFFDKFYPLFRQYEKEYQTQLVELRKKHDQFLLQLESGTGYTLFMEKYNGIFIEWYKAGQKTEFIETYSKLVRKIIPICRDHFVDQNGREVLEIALLADEAYINIESVNSLFKNTFRDFMEIHKRTSRLLTKCMAILQATSLDLVKHKICKAKRTIHTQFNKLISSN